MQPKNAVRGALCAGSFVAFVTVSIAMGASPDGGGSSSDGAGASALARYRVDGGANVYDMLATDTWSVAQGLADLGVLGWVESDGAGGLVCFCSSLDGSAPVIIAVPRTIMGTDIDNDEDTDITPPATTAPAVPSTTPSAVWAQLVRGTDIDNDDDADIVIRPCNPG